MGNKLGFWLKICVALSIALIALPALAAGPNWMPGFPMRMGPSVMLMWTPVPGATAYNIYKSDQKGDLGALVTSIPMNNHMDMNVPMDVSAYYTVKALIGGAEGDPGKVGAIIGVKPLDAPPWQGTMMIGENLGVRWGAIDGASFYNFYKGESATGPFNLVSSVQDTIYRDAEVEQGGTYHYQVSAVDKNSTESPRSEVLTFTIEKVKKAERAIKWEQVDIIAEREKIFYGPDDDPFLAPGYIVLSPDEMIFMTNGNVLTAIDLEGELVGHIMRPEEYEGVWGNTGAMNISDNYLITGWSGYEGVRLFDFSGELVTEWTLAAPTKEEYAEYGREEDWPKDKEMIPGITPSGIAADGEGRIWVFEPTFRQIHIYSDTGELLEKIGEPNKPGRETDVFGTLQAFQYHPATNRMYAIDGSFKRVRAFDCATLDFIKDDEGEPIHGWKRGGTDPGYLQQFVNLNIYGDTLYLMDGIDSRVMTFDLELNYTGTFVDKPGEKSHKDFRAVSSVLLVGDTLYAASKLTKRIVKVKLQ